MGHGLMNSSSAKSSGHRAWSIELEERRDRWFKLLNIEQQNKEPQNYDVITSIFEIPCSIFCGSKRRQFR
jgi:hypothetical protein